MSVWSLWEARRARARSSAAALVLCGVGGSSEVARLATSAKVSVSSAMKLIRLLWWATPPPSSSTDGYDAELRGDELRALGSETPTFARVPFDVESTTSSETAQSFAFQLRGIPLAINPFESTWKVALSS